MKRSIFLISTVTTLALSCKGTEVGNGLKPKDKGTENPAQEGASKDPAEADNNEPAKDVSSQPDKVTVVDYLGLIAAVANPCWHPFSSTTKSPVALVFADGTAGTFNFVKSSPTEWEVIAPNNTTKEFPVSDSLDRTQQSQRTCTSETEKPLDATAALNQRKQIDAKINLSGKVYKMAWVQGINANGEIELESYALSSETGVILKK